MGKPTSRLLGKHAQSFFIGKPVQYRSSMARLGALRGGDVRCLSATFMGVVVCCCVFLLTLQPSQFATTKLSMVDLPKDEVVRAQSIPALAPEETPPTNGKHSGKTGSTGGKKGGKNDQKASKMDKKASKAKWLKDELPKKGHGGGAAASNETKPLTSKAEAMNVSVPEPVLPISPEEASFDKPPNPPELEPPKKPEQPTHDTAEEASRSDSTLHPKAAFSKVNRAVISTFRSPFVESDRSSLEERENKKIITWYKPESVRELHHKKKAFDNCPETQCRVVYPLPNGVRADAIIFDKIDLRGPPPPRLDSSQVYVFHAMQPPPSPHSLWPASWVSAFNWTWTYRKDSDIWQPFGLLRKAKKVKPLEYFENLTKMKTRAVAWMPKSCPTSTPSKRDKFVEELGKYVRIAEFGPCNNKTCNKAGVSCTENLTKKFFFLLAVEDDVCKDHVTEVFYRAWQEGTHVVPVVRGGADYNSYFPEGTYIDADWFDTAKQLSDFMAELMANRKTYTQLLWRKAHWVRASKRMDDVSLCKLCYMLHNLPSSQKRYSDVRRWFETAACRDPLPF